MTFSDKPPVKGTSRDGHFPDAKGGRLGGGVRHFSQRGRSRCRACAPPTPARKFVLRAMEVCSTPQKSLYYAYRKFVLRPKTSLFYARGTRRKVCSTRVAGLLRGTKKFVLRASLMPLKFVLRAGHAPFDSVLRASASVKSLFYAPVRRFHCCEPAHLPRGGVVSPRQNGTM